MTDSSTSDAISDATDLAIIVPSSILYYSSLLTDTPHGKLLIGHGRCRAAGDNQKNLWHFILPACLPVSGLRGSPPGERGR